MKREILFDDLEASGRALVPHLEHYRGDADAIVAGIVRGGIPVATEVARSLHLPLELVVRRSLFIRGIDDAVGVVNAAGHEVLDEGLTVAETPASGEEWFVHEALRAFRERVALCRGTVPPASLAGRTVIVVDNSIRTTLTSRTAIRGVRAAGAARVVLAVPLCAQDVVDAAAQLADEFIVLATPPSFGHAGLFYERLNVPDESAIREAFVNFRPGV